MPVLAAEPDQFPEDLFADERPPHAGERLWWVLHTRPRQEKSLARVLHEAKIPFYLPVIPRQLQVRGRRLTAHIPLFPGYVFLLGDRNERHKALTTHRVVRTLDVPEPERLWEDLRQIRRLIDTGAPIMPEDRLAPGMLVEIRRGPLAGIKGRIIRTATGRRFVVQIDFIQRGASVLLDGLDVALAEP
jgi:transcriptional antiterminator RfaH